MCHAEVVEKIRTHFVNNFFFPENRPVYEILVMWESMVEAIYDVLLNVHLSINLVINQLSAQVLVL